MLFFKERTLVHYIQRTSYATHLRSKLCMQVLTPILNTRMRWSSPADTMWPLRAFTTTAVTDRA